MMRYFETFFRHRIVLVAPMIVALVLGVGYQLKQPPKYESTARLWFDTPLPGPSSVDQPNPNSPPAAQHKDLLTELLVTNDFDVKVLNSIKATVPAGTPLQSDEQIKSGLAKEVRSSTPGPQVLAMVFTASSPALVVSTAKSVVSEFTKQITDTRKARGQAVVDYDKSRVDAAAKEVADTGSKLASYLSGHPAAAGQAPDTTAAQLTQMANLAQQQYTTLTDDLNKANLDLTRVADTSVLRLIDPPSVPTAPLGGKKKVMLIAVGAVFAGALISVLVLVWLTVADSSARREDDIERDLGLKVAGVITPFAANGSKRRARAR